MRLPGLDARYGGGVVRIAYVDMDAEPDSGEVHAADYTQSGMLSGGDVIELGGVVWEIQDVLMCSGSGVISAILGQPVDAVARVRRAVTP